MMRKKIIKAAAIIIALSFLATTFYYYLPQPEVAVTNIVDFNEERDKAEILNIFANDRYWLVASENYSPEFMLENRAPNKEDLRYYGKLNIKVLREMDQCIGFIAYYMKNFFIGTILFIDVKPEFRGKGYARQLLQYAIDDLKRHGATIVTLVTRTTNEAAQKAYKKMGFRVSHEEDGYVYFEIRP